MQLPDKYNSKDSEQKWQEFWQKENIYKFNPDSKAEIYSIDTPPPTVSGKMHLGHAFSYTQQDFVVRFQRMLGKNIFYPFGTDDNGIPTERLVEKTKKIKARNMPRDQFAKLCLDTLEKELRPTYIQDWKKLGMSCDWDIYYTTINEHCQRISQKSFIDLFKIKRAYRKKAAVMWCPECQTGISQVECQDKILDSFFNDIIFKVNSNGKEEDLIIATTRPELLPACVAVFYHPDDKRYQKLKGKKAKVPLFDFEVPILADPRADPEKGTGLVMCCTFGDQTDMEWQKAHNLPIKEAITPDGKMTKLAGKYETHSIQTARKLILEDLKDARLCIGQEPIKHAVNVHERCGTEIEFLNSKQWFIKYLDLKEDMLEWGAKLNWYPQHMKSRYDHWVKGLQWDWLISRQRYFGVPFPVWYCTKCDEIILADENSLPVDPLKDKPAIKECPKCKCKEFTPEKDVLDTWATSSLTPQIAVELTKKELQNKLYPMSLRPQAHDIITFWLFNTVVKSQLHNKVNPWKDVMISGHVLDPSGKKMSKSKGNVIEPQEVINKFSADCLRFWAAGCKLGDDLPYMEKDLVTGQKFITKLWNASKFAIMHLEDYKGETSEQSSEGLGNSFPKKPKKLEVVDRWILTRLSKIIKSSTESFNKYEYSRTKADVENFFWHELCDNYLEIIKDRLYNPDKRGKEARLSAQYGLYTSLLSILKMMAPIMPHITEEIYHLHFKNIDHAKSIHIANWPKEEKLDEKAEKIGELVVFAVEKARQFKSEKSLSLKTPLKNIFLKGKLSKEEFESAKDDIIAATKTENIAYGPLKENSEIDFEIEIEI
ncbi:MAG: valine--tRNA ligase [Nanoarchaeota archaeon]|nr:valine--tRNA ligase [Nanoarchaeota archaeon]MBU1005951.1 valine--tRNA ligase [Nanoarchaeota archaeon]MBU1946159.1 valine--tRNA ligase [Nanoarchaeota archaeon]